MHAFFLTIVTNGHVNLTSILADDPIDARTQACEEFVRQFGTALGTVLHESMESMHNCTTSYEYRYDNLRIRATLIEA